MNRYLPILTLEVKHNYFANGYLRGVIIQPNSLTSRWLQNHGILLKMQGNQTILYAPESKNISKLVRNNLLGLSFECRVDDPYFYGYTNAVPNFDFTKSTLKFTYDLDGENQHSDEEELITKIEPGRSTFVRFLMEIPGYILSMEQPKTLFAQFTARAFPWRYYLVSGSGVDLQTISLGGRDGQLFSGPKETTLPNDQKAVLFDSGSHLIPLSEIPKIDLQLLQGNPSRVLASSMPTPNPQSISAEKDSEGKLHSFAAIYINL